MVGPTGSSEYVRSGSRLAPRFMNGRNGPCRALSGRAVGGGPRPVVCDEELLELIRRDLAASPFHGEGHRKVWMRLALRARDPGFRKRVLLIMREKSAAVPVPGAQPGAQSA